MDRHVHRRSQRFASGVTSGDSVLELPVPVLDQFSVVTQRKTGVRREPEREYLRWNILTLLRGAASISKCMEIIYFFRLVFRKRSVGAAISNRLVYSKWIDRRQT